MTTDSAPHYLSPALRSFQERMRLGQGRFIAEAELRRNEGRPLPNLLRIHLPGVVFVNGTAGRVYASLLTNCLNPQCSKTRCWIGVYENGVRVLGDSGPAVDVNRYMVDQYAGVEFYAGGATIPPEFNGTGGDCGVLLLWSRER